jgi:ABC-type branched-subunit amino acid transport system ATPase component
MAAQSSLSRPTWTDPIGNLGDFRSAGGAGEIVPLMGGYASGKSMTMKAIMESVNRATARSSPKAIR